MREDIVHFLRILKLHRYLKSVKSKYGNVVTVDILVVGTKAPDVCQYVIILRAIFEVHEEKY